MTRMRAVIRFLFAVASSIFSALMRAAKRLGAPGATQTRIGIAARSISSKITDMCPLLPLPDEARERCRPAQMFRWFRDRRHRDFLSITMGSVRQ